MAVQANDTFRAVVQNRIEERLGETSLALPLSSVVTDD